MSALTKDLNISHKALVYENGIINLMIRIEAIQKVHILNMSSARSSAKHHALLMVLNNLLR